MTKRIFGNITLIAAIAVIFAVALVTALLHSYSTDEAAERLEAEAAIIADAVELSGEEYLEYADFSDKIRVTLFGVNGEILFDSGDLDGDFQDEYETDKNPPPWIKSLTRINLSYSERLPDGKILKLSSVHISFASQMLKIIGPILLILTAAAAFSALSAIRVSRSIVKPINDIDLDRPDIEKSYKELTPLLNKLQVQNGKVSRQMEELSRSREQLSLITETMSEGLIIADPKLNVLACNSSALKLLGSPPYTEGQSVYALNNSGVFRRCLLNALGGRRCECILKTGNGKCEIIASPANSVEMVCGIVVFIMDVTEKQQLETMRREFTSNVSHELKTPLTTIYGISDMLANGMVKSEDAERFGAKIRSEADRLITLINDIVSLSKLDEDSVPREKTEVDLYETAAETLSRLEHAAAEKSVKMSLSGETVKVIGSRTILEEILYNLCDNAIKYNKDGGSVEVKLSHAPQTAIITVSDTGIGIPQQHIGRIFERFYRVDKSRSRKIKGTGLGLSIVKHGVMYHDGSVRAESSEGNGTVFTVELPIRKKEYQ